MTRTLAALAFAAMAFNAAAQTNGVPPEQPAAGNPGKLVFKRPVTATPAAQSPAATPAEPMTTAEKRAARKAKRAAKVGPKPLD